MDSYCCRPLLREAHSRGDVTVERIVQCEWMDSPHLAPTWCRTECKKLFEQQRQNDIAQEHNSLHMYQQRIDEGYTPISEKIRDKPVMIIKEKNQKEDDKKKGGAINLDATEL